MSACLRLLVSCFALLLGSGILQCMSRELLNNVYREEKEYFDNVKVTGLRTEAGRYFLQLKARNRDKKEVEAQVEIPSGDSLPVSAPNSRGIRTSYPGGAFISEQLCKDCTDLPLEEVLILKDGDIPLPNSNAILELGSVFHNGRLESIQLRNVTRVRYNKSGERLLLIYENGRKEIFFRSTREYSLFVYYPHRQPKRIDESEFETPVRMRPFEFSGGVLVNVAGQSNYLWIPVAPGHSFPAETQSVTIIPFKAEPVARYQPALLMLLPITVALDVAMVPVYAIGVLLMPDIF